MSFSSYSEQTSDTESVARQSEADALQRNIELLEGAREKGSDSPEAAAALHATRQVWGLLIEDLGRAENSLPQDLRANLISIGLWIIQECETIRQGKSKNFAGIIDVTRLVKEGLS